MASKIERLHKQQNGTERWTCTLCSTLNFAFRDTCFSKACDGTRPSQGATRLVRAVEGAGKRAAAAAGEAGAGAGAGAGAATADVVFKNESSEIIAVVEHSVAVRIKAELHSIVHQMVTVPAFVRRD